MNPQNNLEFSDQSKNFEQSIIRPQITFPSVKVDHHQKNPLLSQASNQTYLLSKTVFDNTIFANITKTMPNTSLNSGVNSLKKYQMICSQPELLEIFGTDNILDESQFTKLIKEQYQQRELMFIAVTGSQKSGKSLFCDSILKLSGYKGNHYCRTQKKGSFLWSHPFSKDNMRIFLIQITFDSFQTQQQYIEMVKKLRRLVSVWVAMDIKGFLQLDSVLKFISKHQKDRQMINMQAQSVYLLSRQFYENNKLFILPTPHIYILPSASLSGEPHQQASLKDLPISAYNPEYVNQIQKVFYKIYEQCQEFRFDNKAILTGQLFLSIQKPLQNEEEEQIKQILTKKVEKQYQMFCNLSYENYMEQINVKLAEQNLPMQMNSLYNKLNQISERTFIKYGQYDQNFMNIALRQKYYNTLQAKIEQSENTIIQLNVDKTHKALQRVFENKDYKHYNDLVKALKVQRPQLNHGREIFVKQKIQNLLSQQNQSVKPSGYTVNSMQRQLDNHKIDYSPDTSQLQKKRNQKYCDLQRIQKLKQSIAVTQGQIDRIQKNAQKTSNIQETNKDGQMIVDESHKNQQKKQKKRLELQLAELRQELQKIKNNQLEQQQIGQIQKQKIQQKQELIKMQRQIQNKIQRIRDNDVYGKPPKRQKKRNFCGLKF